MFGNGVSWMCLTSLDLSNNEDMEYVYKEMSVQPGIIILLNPMCLPDYQSVETSGGWRSPIF